MINWKDYYAQEQVRQDRLREAKQQRLVTMLSRNLREERKKARDLMLERVGYRLVLWGDALLRRVDERSLAG
jgi:flagellin-specific chaperone FliS